MKRTVSILAMATVWASEPYTLYVNGKKVAIKKGMNRFGKKPPQL